ncbi:hypothetical protein LINPERHAP1_LOCUS21287, partial [Linum perenne]
DETASFSVRSFDSQLCDIKFPGVGDFPFDTIWIKAVPLKIQCFVWLIFHNRISTLDVLKARGFCLPNRCALCLHNEELASHLFIHCPFISSIWSKISSRLSIFGPFPAKASELISGWKWLNCKSSFGNYNSVVLHSFCWYVWLERNDVIFRDATASAT